MDYPRWRGEHFSTEYLNAARDGLSPLARGTLHRPRLQLGYARFIPAGAGNTAKRPAKWGRAPVYPRWRGEHYGQIGELLFRIGLSPLARGTLRKGSYSDKEYPVYPRWRGEHLIVIS